MIELTRQQVSDQLLYLKQSGITDDQIPAQMTTWMQTMNLDGNTIQMVLSDLDSYQI